MMLKSLRVRISQGSQVIPDVRAAKPAGFRGLPVIQPGACGDCTASTSAPPCGGAARPGEAGTCPALAACPTSAITAEPLAIDLGRCIFCGECEAACPAGKIALSNEPRMGAVTRAGLIVKAGDEAATRVRAHDAFRKLFGRSLKLRQVSAGGCSACELELNATANVNFDLGRFGIDWVASPRHADALVLTGTVTRTMQDAVRLAWDAMAEPRFVVAVGACAISGGLYDGAAGVARGFFDEVVPALYVPGCPPHPLTFVNALLDFLGVA